MLQILIILHKFYCPYIQNIKKWKKATVQTKLTHNNLFERIALIGNLEKIKQLQLKGMECSIEH